MAETPTAARYVILEGRVRDLEEDNREIKGWVNGNGKPGAKTTLATLDHRIGNIERMLDGLQKSVNGLIASVVGAVIIYILLTVIPQVAK